MIYAQPAIKDNPCGQFDFHNRRRTQITRSRFLLEPLIIRTCFQAGEPNKKKSFHIFFRSPLKWFLWTFRLSRISNSNDPRKKDKKLLHIFHPSYPSKAFLIIKIHDEKSFRQHVESRQAGSFSMSQTTNRKNVVKMMSKILWSFCRKLTFFSMNFFCLNIHRMPF